ncbi:MAG TPA: DUF4272 domain-containing protein [Verrucomicrobiae bacterium]|jgi:hypothetical protein
MPEDIQYVEQIRGADEVARRCLVLYAVIAAGHEGPRTELVTWLQREKLWESASPNERSFLQSAIPTQQQRANATWRVEALAPLLWALGVVSELPPPTGLCDVQGLRRVLPPLMGLVSEWLSAAQLRLDSEIHDANESIYQIHWAVRDAQLNGRPVPQEYYLSVVQERHYALNWLIGYCGQEWDDITTDT